MKKGVKITLIIIILAGLVFLGYLAYKRFFVNEVKEIEAQKGGELFAAAISKTQEKQYFYVAYATTNAKGQTNISKNGALTVDERGYYHKWTSGDVKGSKYIVNSGQSYRVFEEFDGVKSNSTITGITYASDYKNLNDVENLGFIGNKTTSSNELSIKETFYASKNTQKEEFKHLFGETKTGYVFKTTYTCNYIDATGTMYQSKFIREVYFDTLIRSVKYEISDVEIDAEEKVIKSGAANKYEGEYKIQYNTNQALVKVNFSEYVNP